MMRFTKIIFPTVLALVLVGMSWVVVENYKSVQELNKQGKPAVTVATPLAGADGKDGRSAYQIWLDNGHTGSEIEFLHSLRGINGAPGERGADGKDGVDGADGANGLDGADGLSIKGEKGDKGETGATGSTGATGPAGASPQMACVIRTTNGVATKYVAWKYVNEPNSAYRDLYKLPAWAECVAPVDLTV